MKVFTKKSEPEQLLETVNNSLHALSENSTKSKLMKLGLIAVSLAGLTAGSAAISSLRRRTETTKANP